VPRPREEAVALAPSHLHLIGGEIAYCHDRFGIGPVLQTGSVAKFVRPEDVPKVSVHLLMHDNHWFAASATWPRASERVSQAGPTKFYIAHDLDIAELTIDRIALGCRIDNVRRMGGCEDLDLAIPSERHVTMILLKQVWGRLQNPVNFTFIELNIPVAANLQWVLRALCAGRLDPQQQT
jgi:hypothetical protein